MGLNSSQPRPTAVGKGWRDRTTIPGELMSESRRERAGEERPDGAARSPLRDAGVSSEADGGMGREVFSPRGEPFAVVGRAGPVELHGAPPIPAEAREELLVLKDGELYLCARTDGDVAPAQVSGEGFYMHDMRHLSE
ncbi:MAG: amylo-alpha,6-glucosidase, partial [Solirubrobacterales bacterium]|nr:amylo-alpha,6-glucosidase [Solirubrobacterales bacterium]